MKSILIVEDVQETRAWLVGAVKSAFAQCDIRQASDVRSALYEIKVQKFDLALIDLGLPDGLGTKVIEALCAAQPNAMAIVATVMGDDASIISALSAGAKGYLLKDSPIDLFILQLTNLKNGLPALSPSIARRIVDHFRISAPDQQGESELTPRELEVLGLISKGLRNAEAAKMLGLMESTVASHIKSIYAKLGISSRAQAAIRAERLGLLRQ